MCMSLPSFYTVKHNIPHYSSVPYNLHTWTMEKLSDLYPHTLHTRMKYYLGQEHPLELILEVIFVLCTATLEVGMDQSKAGFVDHRILTAENKNTCTYTKCKSTKLPDYYTCPKPHVTYVPHWHQLELCSYKLQTLMRSLLYINELGWLLRLHHTRDPFSNRTTSRWDCIRKITNMQK